MESHVWVRTCGRECATCAEIVDALVELVAVESTAVPSDVALAERATVSLTVLVEHVGSALGCYLATYEASMDRLWGLAEVELSRSAPWEERLHGSLRAQMLAAAEDPLIGTLCFAAPLTTDRDVLMVRDRLHVRCAAQLARASGEEHPYPPPVAFQVLLGALARAVHDRRGAGLGFVEIAEEAPRLCRNVLALVPISRAVA